METVLINITYIFNAPLHHLTFIDSVIFQPPHRIEKEKKCNFLLTGIKNIKQKIIAIEYFCHDLIRKCC